MKLTKNIMDKYGIEIDSQVIECISLPRPLTLYTINCIRFKIQWSGLGQSWLAKSKRDLCSILESVETK